MTTGFSRWADVSSVVAQIYEGSFHTFKETNALQTTVTYYADLTGMNPRNVNLYNAANVRQTSEGEDVTPTQFNKTNLATLTPVRYSDQFLLTDERLTSDSDAVRDDAVLELGGAFAENVDTKIAAQYPNLTGGTVGAFLGTVSPNQIFAARSILQQNKIRGPYFCVLGAGQWYHLANNGGTIDTSFTRATPFQDRLINNYFTMAGMGDIIFVTSPNINGAGGGSATGALYSPIALAYDERTPFTIEPQRDASRQAWELNANMRYATGVWRALAGIQIRSTDVIPTT